LTEYNISELTMFLLM